METSADIFEVLTAFATLVAVVLAVVVLTYLVVVMRAIHALTRRAERGADFLAREIAELMESAKRERGGITEAAVILSGFLWRVIQKRRQRKRGDKSH